MSSPNEGHDYCLAVIRRPLVSSGAFPTEILTILKDRPEWQKGRINLPGGRVEQGEDPREATIREIKEETGYDVSSIKKMGVMNDGMFKIHIFFAVLVDPIINPTPREGETELCLWRPLYNLMLDERLLPNLRAIIPLVLCDVEGFEISDQARSEFGTTHSFTLTVPTHRALSGEEFEKALASIAD